MLADIRSRMLHMSYVDFLVCKRCFRCWLCDFLFSRQNGAERKQRPIFTFFPPPFSSHSARHRLLLLGYPLSGKSMHQLSNYKRKNCWIYKLSIYFSNARFHMLFGFRPASGRESVSLVCPHCRLWLPAHSTSIWISAYPECGSSSPVPVRATSRTVKVAVTMGYVFTF